MLTMESSEQSAVAAEWTARKAQSRPMWIEGFGPIPDHTAAEGARGLVSVVLPTRNRGRMTRTAIESVLAQTWVDWELLVVDDGSEDDTAFVAEILAGRDPRITVIRSEARGASAARNRGLAVARGDFVAFLDSDVVWQPDFLRALMAQLHGTGADVVYANVRGLIGEGFRFRSPHVLLPELLLKPLLDLSSVLIRRALVDAVGTFDESLPRAGEYDYLIRLAQQSRLQYTPMVGAEVEVHPRPYPRVSSTESDDWVEIVQTRHEVDWAAERRRFRVPNIRSVIIPLGADATAAVEAARAELDGGGRVEVVFVDHADGDSVATALAPFIDADDRLSYVRMPVPTTSAHAATLGFPRTHGTSVTVVLPDGTRRVLAAADVIADERIRPEVLR